MDGMKENGLYDEDKFGVTLRIAEVQIDTEMPLEDTYVHTIESSG